MFTSSVKTGALYSFYHPDVEIPDNEDILEMLKEKCKEAEFLGETKRTPIQEVMKNIKHQKEQLDGLICFGTTQPINC